MTAPGHRDLVPTRVEEYHLRGPSEKPVQDEERHAAPTTRLERLMDGLSAVPSAPADFGLE